MKKQLFKDDELEYQGFCDHMDKKMFIKIDYGKSVYYFFPGEIIQNLPDTVLAAGIQRGKAIARASEFRRRCDAGQAARERKLDKVFGVV